jgi:hypothetical protein
MIDHCYCYCLYGRDLIYYEPLKLVAQKLANNPSAVIFLGTVDVDFNFVSNYYAKYTNIKVYCFGDDYKSRERLVRFLAPKYVKAKYYHYRDADSAITDFEQSLISIYIELQLPILILRNHPLHYSPVMAGMFSLNLEFGVKLVAFVEEKLSSIESKYYYDQVFLTNTLYEKYKSEALVFSSHIGYEGELVHKIMFDKYNFIGQPKFWDVKDCDVAFNEACLLRSRALVKLPFYSFLSALYQRGRFIKLLIMVSKLQIWRSAT